MGRLDAINARSARAMTVLMLAVLVSVGLTVPIVPAAAAIRVKPFDFNGDGSADLAVGVPGEGLGAVVAAGLVEVIYGSQSAGLTAEKSQSWSKRTAGIKGKISTDDRFGSAVTSGDFDGDGFADLAIGARGHALGSVSVLYGSPSGLTTRDQLFTSPDLGQQDRWGTALTAGDFNGDGRSDLAIGGAPPLSDHDPERAGAVDVLYGGRSGLTRHGATHITKNSPGIPGVSEDGDAFGYRLASGDINGDGRDDLLLGTRHRTDTGGGAYVLYGSAQGLTTAKNRYFATNTAGLAPAHTKLSSLGSAVGVADFDGDGYADIAVADDTAGPPGSLDCSTAGDDCPGAVIVLRGSASGVTTQGRQLWYLDAPGIPGEGVGYDSFGASLSTGDLNGDGRADIAIGALDKGVGDGNDDSGTVSIIYGGKTGLKSAHAQLWTQDSAGLKGHSAGFTYFGEHLRIADFGYGASADLAASSVAGAPMDQAGGTDAGKVQVLYGSSRGLTSRDQVWSQDTPGIAGTGEATDLFGVL